MLLIKTLLIETLLIKKRVFATNVWTAAAHIPGNSYHEAHLYSRKLDSANEWQLNTTIFKNINETFGSPKPDLLSSRINTLLPHFAS